MAAPSRQNSRIVLISREAANGLEERKAQTDAPVSSQIRRAIESYLRVEPTATHRLLITPLAEVRASANIPDSLWNALKARKVETGLDLNEQVQVAIELWLQGEADAPEVPPPAPDAPALGDIEQLIEKTVDTRLQEWLSEQTREVHLPKTRMVCCGAGDGIDNVVTMTPGTVVTITGRLASLATPGSYIAEAHGWSMADGDSLADIRPGDQLLLTPFDEFKGTLRKGAVVLARVEFNDGTVIETLKLFEGRRLKASNPAFPAIKLGESVVKAEVVAVCRGVVERVFC